MLRRSLIGFLAAVMLFLAGVLTACAPSTVPSSGEDEPADGKGAESEAWVVVIFEDRPENFDVDLMDALLETEMSADEALADARLGQIDGNEVGGHGYELYFVGDDADAMWSVIEPVFASAPVPWTRVELRSGLDDPSPVVLTQP